MDKSFLSKIKEIDKVYNYNYLFLSKINEYMSQYDYQISIIIKNNYTKGFYLNFLIKMLFNDLNEEIKQVMVNYYLNNNIIELDVNTFQNNPYYKKIKFPQITYKNWTLKYQEYKGFELFPYGEIMVNDFIEVNPLGFFKESFQIPTILQDGREWMMINPNEVITMKNSIENAFGNVVTYGLGLGYFAFMVHEKETVNKVYIIEKDSSVISIFKKFIFPLFSYQNKIEIIQDDALLFNINKLNKIDYVFVDIWHDQLDGIIPYIKMKQKEQRGIIYHYWIEKTLLYRIRYCVYIVLFDKIMDHNKLYDDMFLNCLHCFFKKVNLQTIADINQYLSIDYIKNILIKTIKI